MEFTCKSSVNKRKKNRLIGQVDRVFANGPGDLGSIPGRFISKTLKMVLDTFLLNTHQYKVHIKGKVEQSRERSNAPPTPRCSSYWKGSLLVAYRLQSSLLLYLNDWYEFFFYMMNVTIAFLYNDFVYYCRNHGYFF